jgi:hypothetical protein
VKTEAGLVVAIAVIAGLGLLASSGPPRPVRTTVVLNKAPPPLPRSKLVWGTWPAGGTTAPAVMAEDQRLVVEAAPSSKPPARSPSAAGIWSTPAEFADSD